MEINRLKQENISGAVKKELGDNTEVSFFVKRKIPKTADFVMVYQETMKKILEGEISLSTVKVFAYMMMNMSFENFIGIDLKSISDKIRMPLPTVKKAMSELKDSGMLIAIKDNFDARRNVYRLNPIIAWKGKVTSRIKASKDNPGQFNLFTKEEHSLLPMAQKTSTIDCEQSEHK